MVKIISSAMLLRTFALSLLLSSSLGQKWVSALFHSGVRQELDYHGINSYKISKQYGGSLTSWDAGVESFHFEMGLIYRFVNLSKLSSYLNWLRGQHYLALSMGVRYYPYSSTFSIGSLGFRLTGGPSVGMGFKFTTEGGWFPGVALCPKVGLRVSIIGKPDGILLEPLYLPLAEPIVNPRGNIDPSVVVKPAHLVGAGFILAN